MADAGNKMETRAFFLRKILENSAKRRIRGIFILHKNRTVVANGNLHFRHLYFVVLKHELHMSASLELVTESFARQAAMLFFSSTLFYACFKGESVGKIHYNNLCIRFGSCEVRRLNQSRSTAVIPGWARREKLLSRSELNWPFWIDSDAVLHMNLIHWICFGSCEVRRLNRA